MNETVKDRVRPDGKEKVTGELKYLTDLTFPNMLYGKVLRSKYPHANILSICTKKAEELAGVKAVVTSKDVKGMNRFGIVFPDQPVFCEERVRYIGDAIAAVAAESERIAEQALEIIEVCYEELPIISSPEQALEKNAVKLHPNGNVLYQAQYEKGDVEEGFANCDVIIEETYKLPRQAHLYMETEGGVVVPEEDGKITVYMGTQHGYKDRFQLARILAIPEQDIRVVSSPMGGSFGGKDELNVQQYGAILALKTQQPVKIHQTRRESIRSSIKRHPMKIRMKTGATRKGKVLAQETNIIADTGAYATLGPAVLDFAVEHAIGPYLIPHVKTKGVSVFTNNGVAGEFRGFGGNQITFALEGQMDRLAEELKIEPLQIRAQNLRETFDPGPLGQKIAPTDGARDVLCAIGKSPILQKERRRKEGKLIGVGTAITMHGGGLGFGRLDAAGGRLSLTKDGEIEISFGFEECGQGLLSVIENITTEELGCAPKDLKIVIGDTKYVPSSGSSTASRGTSMVWQAIQRMKGEFKAQLLQGVSQFLNLPTDCLLLGGGGIWYKQDEREYNLCLTYKEVAKHVFSHKLPCVETHFHFPTTPDAVVGGHFLYAFGAVAVEVEVDVITGMVKVSQMDHAIAAGPVISERGYQGQIEGGAAMALGYSLMEDSHICSGLYTRDNIDTYLIPSISDLPLQMNISKIETLYKEDRYGPRGVGEIGTIAVAPAIAAAVYDATKCFVNKLPLQPENILDHLEEGAKK